MYSKEDQETYITEYTIEITHIQNIIENTHYLPRTGEQNSANRKHKLRFTVTMNMSSKMKCGQHFLSYFSYIVMTKPYDETNL